jgi:putative AdoMet-dependent methyltransferase
MIQSGVITMEKLTISEVANRLNITNRAIRFYEEKELISPEKNPLNQYRLFSEKEVWRLQTIMSLREMGLSLEGIQEVLSKVEFGNGDEVEYYLETQQAALFSKWVELKQMLKTLDKMIDQVKQTGSLDMEQIHPLAEGYRRLKDLRSHWQDRWNFDRQASTYDDRVKNNQLSDYIRPIYHDALNKAVEWISPVAKEKGLDIGTGTGNLAGRFLEKQVNMFAIDQSREMLKQCQQKYPQMPAKLGNFLAIPFFDGEFDFICTSFALHHLTEEQKDLAYEEMNRVLSERGRICIVDLMFEDEASRLQYIEELRKQGDDNEIKNIEDEYYADRSHMISWFKSHGYTTMQQKLNDVVHIFYAIKIH